MTPEGAAPRIVCLLGSSRRNGNTGMIADAVLEELPGALLVDLSNQTIAPYDYDSPQEGDDFLAIVRRMLDADAIIFASPVYWYAMSGLMKNFFDRLTDLTGRYKKDGRRLAGKTMYVIGTSTGPMPASFVRPFSDTAGYFNMRWGGMLAVRFPEDLTMPDGTGHLLTRFAHSVAHRTAFDPD